MECSGSVSVLFFAFGAFWVSILVSKWNALEDRRREFKELVLKCFNPSF
tara:strand:- start:891 stop:1037 length:147 start_codon:yes stop_codon:yes gene_type:complete